MPLSKGKSKKAFEHNIKAEMHAGKPQDQALAIAYSVKRKAKKKAAGGSVESGSKDMNMADGGDIKGVHESFYDQGMSRAGAKARKPEKSDYDKAVARKEHIKVLSEQRSMPKPKLQGLAEGGQPKPPSLQNIKDAEMRKRKGIGIDEAMYQKQEAKKRRLQPLAEGGSVKNEKRPMPNDRHNDSAEVSRNSGNKPSRHDNWLDRSTEAQAQSNNGRMVKRIKRPSMVPSDAFSTRLYNEEDDLQSSARPAQPDEQPPRHDDEEGPDRQGPELSDKSKPHSTGKLSYAKGGEVEAKDYADGKRDHDDGLHLEESDSPSEDEGSSHAHSLNEERPDRQGPAHREEAPHSPSSRMFHDDEANEDMDMELNPAHDKHSPDDSESQPSSPRDNDYYDDDGKDDSIAAAIMAKRDRLHDEVDSGAHDEDSAASYARGGAIMKERPSRILSHGSTDSDESSQVDLSRNADEDANEEDQLSWDSLMKENYSESPGLDALDQPEDSNEHSDSEEMDSHDRHDRVSAIRARMKKKQFNQR